MFFGQIGLGLCIEIQIGNVSQTEPTLAMVVNFATILNDEVSVFLGHIEYRCALKVELQMSVMFHSQIHHLPWLLISFT